MTPGEIGTVARAAGFHGGDLTTAVACALASSGGNPAYDVAAGLAGAGRWRGLWAINVDRVAGLTDQSFADPYTDAEAARWLTRTSGGFDWNDAYRAGRHDPYMALSATALTDRMKPRSIPNPVAPLAPAAIRRARLADRAAAHVDTRHAAAHRRIGR